MVIPKKKWVGLKKEEPNVFDAFRDGVLITDLDSEIAVTFRCCCGKHFQQEPGYEIPRTTLTRSVRDKQMKHTTKFYAKVSLKSFCSFNFSGLYFRGHRLEPMRLGGVKRRQTITIPHSPPLLFPLSHPRQHELQPFHHLPCGDHFVKCCLRTSSWYLSQHST